MRDANIDDENIYDDLDIDERRRVDAQLNRRDRMLRSQRGLPDAFLDDGDEDMGIPSRRRRRNQYDEEFDRDAEDDDPMNQIM